MASTSQTRPALSPAHLADIAKLLVAGSLPGELDGFGPAARKAAAAFVATAISFRKSGQPSIAIDTLADTDGKRKMRIAVVNSDMPFLVDSVAANLSAKGLVIDRLLHPVIPVRRDTKGAFEGLGKGGKPESVIYIETDRAEARVRAEIREGVIQSLSDVRHAVADWPALKDSMRADALTLNGDEQELLDWFADNNLTLLGAATFAKDGAFETGAGIGRDKGEGLLSVAARRRALAHFRASGDGLIVLKSNMLSLVHRRVPLDLLIVPRRDGLAVMGLSIHAGLWTSAALGRPAAGIPLLRKRLAALQDKYRFDPHGHAGKALGHALTTLPHDIAISIDDDALETLALTAMSIADRPRPRLELVGAPLDRHLFAFVWLPRDELTTARRIAIARMLEDAASAQLLSWAIELGDGEVALIRYTLDIRDGGKVPDVGPLHDRIEMMVRGWESSVEASLAKLGDAGHAARLALRYAGAFPVAYRNGAGPDEAALDVSDIHALADATSRRARFYRNADDGPGRLRLKLYSLEPLTLSDAVPALEYFGFHVVEELSTALDGGRLGHIQKFVLDTASGRDAGAIVKSPAVLQTALAQVLEGAAENDEFNQLIVELGIAPFAVTLFRALFRYLRQTGVSYGLVTVVGALRNAPEIARALSALFAARHGPDASEKVAADADADISRGLTRVSAIDDDRILRLYRAVIRATLRTNAFAPAAREALAFKIDSAQVPGLPDPKPWREIFVYSPRVEGIHLRAGPVARGGLRWSDRRDDFRTEILGLMKAQRVKNAVIVPTGAKGGFYPKHLPDASHRDAWLAEGTECYRIFIRSLLSVTDNLVKGKVVHPEGVVIHDGEDPYFVVAADKGTATFSDVANAIALERGFWLGDAFASGGSVGYDHKAMGITAKGGWVSVQRHFAEAGVDVQKDRVRVVGCGDMSGDVFGNGMLLSKSLNLVAAFDHRHIFFDPDPDPAASWKERARMFKLPRSSWADYDASLISKGGGVFPRSAKEIKLSKEMRAILGVTETVLDPSSIISAILKSEADLIWFGGIGTYVKARAENNAEVGDRANDAHRVNAEDLRAKVIGEGANLGVTQAARIAFALRGGRINTDFIDNSAGVDCSDNEVNIKIALNTEVASGKLGLKARNNLLASMTDDVSAIVLEDNRLQTLTLSIAQRTAVDKLPALIRLIEGFEADGKLDRVVEGIASNEELSRRAAEGRGLTRPELAVVMATAKLSLQAAIETTRLGSDPATLPDLVNAFPAAMRKKHRNAIEGHRLRGEIIATKLANRVVNRLGLIHPFELAEEEGVALGDVAEAFVIAEQVHGLDRLWAALDDADVAENVRLMLFEQVAIEVRAHMADVLRNSIESRSNDKAIAAYAPAVATLDAHREALLPAEARKQIENYAARLATAGAPKRLIEPVTRLVALDGSIGLAAHAAKMKVDVIELTRAFTALGASLGIDWAQGTAMQLDPRDPWERLLAASLARDFQAMRLDFLTRLGGGNPLASVEKWTAGNADRIVVFRNGIDRAQKGSMPTPAMLAQIAGQARVLLGR
jgi:glutamate dehydrogenase